MKQKITTIRAPHSTRWRWGSESGILVIGIGKHTRCLGDFSASVAVLVGRFELSCEVVSRLFRSSNLLFTFGSPFGLSGLFGESTRSCRSFYR